MKTSKLAVGPDSAPRANAIGVFDRAAEDRVAREFGPRIYLMALVRTGDPEAAKDLSQSTLVEVLQALRKGQLRERDKLAAFICGTARNVINYHLRARGRAPRIEPIGDDSFGMDAAQALELERAERLSLVRRAMVRLDPGDRRILTMTLIEGAEPAEIAARLGLSSDVVRQRKSRATRRVIEVVERLSQNRRKRH